MHFQYFNALVLFNQSCDVDFTDVYLGPYLTSTMQRFCENSYLLNAASYFAKKLHRRYRQVLKHTFDLRQIPRL